MDYRWIQFPFIQAEQRVYFHNALKFAVQFNITLLTQMGTFDAVFTLDVNETGTRNKKGCMIMCAGFHIITPKLGQELESMVPCCPGPWPCPGFIQCEYTVRVLVAGCTLHCIYIKRILFMRITVKCIRQLC